MSIEFELPEVSEGVTSVDVAEVRVKEGDVIESGAIVCEVETDKAVAEINCPHGGKITKILIKSGDKIKVGQPILMIDATGVAAAPTSKPTPAPSASAPPAPATPASPAPVQKAKPAAASGPVEFKLPEVSEGVVKVDVAAVNVKVGDAISSGDVVCEVETDKAVAEINCPHAGTITAIHVTPGMSITIGAPLLTINTTAATAVAADQPAPAVSAKSSGASDVNATVPTAPNAPLTAPASTAATIQKSDGPPAAAGPGVRRFARKLGVNLKQINGTAAGGRITLEDVEAYVHNRMTQPTPNAATGPGYGMVQAAPLPDFGKFGPVEKQPMNKIFRMAASNLHTAWVTIPHVTQHDLADITELESARKRYVKANPGSPKITMTAIMIKAVVGALKAYPNFNSSVDMATGELILKKYYHIGVAVDTPNGLVVPVIRNCDQKNVLQVAAELSDVAARARDRKLKTEEMQGGSFTITNLGGIGGTAFTPIVNYPEVAILGMSRGQSQLVMEDGQITERLMLPLSLSYDHRAVNGADAARFIVKLSGSLTNFFELF
ncbi:MAG: 2-oxo acid dehydrogenase subunit E2 [Planctomycetaceae bacterium]|nr:2-oxo acid dehydrogenase subunit E2 [Planctomycetaceae bacterium]